MSGPASGCSAAFLTVWLCGWTCGVVAFDAVIGWSAFHQVRALTFPTARGVVTQSGVRSIPGEDGPTYRLNVAYEYEVDGRRYTGTRYCYAEVGTNSRAWHAVRDELPVGAPVRVFYDPDDPAESLLRPGLSGQHVSMLWFLTPFNVVMIGGWVLLLRPQAPPFDPDDPHWAEPLPSGGVRVRLPGVGKGMCFAACLIAITFPGTFVLGFGFGFDPPPVLAGFAYLAAVAAALRVAVWYTPPAVELDELDRVLRVGPVEVPFALARAVGVRRQEGRDGDGDPTYRYHCELEQVGSGDPVRVASFDTPEPADKLAAWLRARLGVPAAPTPG